MSARTVDLFWAKVEKTDGCWNWTAATGRGGYGRFRYGNRVGMAHRFAYEMTHGDIPAGLDVDHVCHNAACVNPAHLRTTTHKQNAENRSGANRNSKSGIRGVSWNAAGKRWEALVRHNGELIQVGSFSTREEAGAAVKSLRLELFTHNDADRISA